MSNLDTLVRVVGKLGALHEEFVFVGGIVNGLYVTVPLTPGPRPTTDVDVVCEAVTYSGYMRVGRALADLGFGQGASRGDPPFRWRHESDILDVIPVGEDVLGFTNRWYRRGIADPWLVEMKGGGPRIKLFAPPYHLAAKLAAYADREADDPFASPDLEDIVGLLANRPELVAEVQQADPVVSTWIREAVRWALADERQDELLSAHLPPDLPRDALAVVRARVRAVTQEI